MSGYPFLMSTQGLGSKKVRKNCEWKIKKLSEKLSEILSVKMIMIIIE